MYSPQNPKSTSPNTGASTRLARISTSPLKRNRQGYRPSVIQPTSPLKRSQADVRASDRLSNDDESFGSNKKLKLSTNAASITDTTISPTPAIREPTFQLPYGYGGRAITENNDSNQPSSNSQISSQVNWDNSLSDIALASAFEQKIRVCVRKRPLNKQELLSKEVDIAPQISTRTLEIHAPKQKVDLTKYTEQHSFTFDDVFDSNASNRSIYERTAQPLVYHMFQGGKATCFAYGQTGSGKTYTMLHPNHGLYFQAIHDIFNLLGQPQYAHLQASAGYYEIYQGQLHDLLNKRKRLIPREDGKGNIIISGLTEHRIRSSTTMKQVFEHGNKERTTCKTLTNENSSRSHAVLQILLKRQNGLMYGKLNFIDLAGSERGTDRGRNPDMKTRMEGAEINRSLLALKECIRALDQDKKHAPFRGSKLTMVLRDSFVGNSKTCMIATISPNNSNSDHTLNTLRYADRVKELRGETDPRLAYTITQRPYYHADAFEQATSISDYEQTIAYNTSSSHKEADSPSRSSPPLPPSTPLRLTTSHIRAFIHEHKIQMEAVESYLRDSNSLIEDLEYTMEHLLPVGGDIVNQLLEERYRDYRSDLHHKGNRVKFFLDKLKARIEEDLGEEEDVED